VIQQQRTAEIERRLCIVRAVKIPTKNRRFEQFGFIRLVEVASAGRAFTLPRAEFSLDIHWKKLFDDDALLDGGLELVVDDVQLIEGALHEMVGEISPDVDGVFKTQFVEHPGPFLSDRP